MASVAGGVAHRQQDRLVLGATLQRAADQAGLRDLGFALEAVEGAELVEVAGAAGWRHLLGQNQLVLEIGIATRAIAHLEVGLFGGDVEQRDRHLEDQLDVGIGAAKQLLPGRHELPAASRQQAA